MRWVKSSCWSPLGVVAEVYLIEIHWLKSTWYGSEVHLVWWLKSTCLIHLVWWLKSTWLKSTGWLLKSSGWSSLGVVTEVHLTEVHWLATDVMWLKSAWCGDQSPVDWHPPVAVHLVWWLKFVWCDNWFLLVEVQLMWCLKSIFLIIEVRWLKST